MTMVKTIKKKRVLVTADGLKKLRDELNYLVSVRRREVLSNLATALEQESSLVGNVAYDQVLDERDKLEGRINELTEMLSNASVDGGGSRGKVGVGSTVTVEVEGEKETYVIVNTAEIDGDRGHISYESPLGGALLGRSVEEAVTIEVPAGKLVYKIVDVR